MRERILFGEISPFLGGSLCNSGVTEKCLWCFKGAVALDESRPE